MIVKQGGKFVVKSEDGSKHLGTYDTEEEAQKRLGQIEWFKAHPRERGGLVLAKGGRKK